ncbi:MAG TPA: radical SAM protein [Acidobacteriota bacterium]|nr:radical SAM protein [Acidobacteriota bacterium]
MEGERDRNRLSESSSCVIVGGNLQPNEEIYPSYLRLLDSGELQARAAAAAELLVECRLCPRACGVRRLQGEAGKCGVGRMAKVSSWFPHHGEEACLRGWKGSGTLFFAGCNLKCVFCQNYEISWNLEGREMTPGELAEAMLQLQRLGCHNLNLVTPTHVTAQVLGALVPAAERGLTLPIVYNSSGYDSPQTLRLLEGVVDIYMPDLKFGDSKTAASYTAVGDYWEVACEAIREMHRQVGDLTFTPNGLAYRGLLVRHLLLPGGLAGTETVLRFLAEEISPGACVNLMTQYRPAAHAWRYPELRGRPGVTEYAIARTLARRLGLRCIEDMG